MPTKMYHPRSPLSKFLRAYWPDIVAITLACFSVLYAIYALSIAHPGFIVLPLHKLFMQTQELIIVSIIFYWCCCPIVILFVIRLALIGRERVLIVLALLITIVLCLGTSFFQRSKVIFVDQQTLGGQSYLLTVQTSDDYLFFTEYPSARFHLYTCDRFMIFCNAIYSSEVFTIILADYALEVNEADQTIAIVEYGEVVYTHHIEQR